MSLVKLASLQIGKSGTASNNFHWRNLLDGALRLSRGNAGAPITDVMRVKADNSVEFPGYVLDPRTWQDATGSRVLATTYSNTDKLPRVLAIRASAGTTVNAFWQLLVDGVVRTQSTQAYSASAVCVIQNFEIPAGSTYRLELVSGPAPIAMWSEYRV